MTSRPDAADQLASVGRKLKRAQKTYDDEQYDRALIFYGSIADELVYLLTTCPDRSVVLASAAFVEQIFDAFVQLERRFAWDRARWLNQRDHPRSGLDPQWVRWEIDQLLAAWRDLSDIVNRHQSDQS